MPVVAKPKSRKQDIALDGNDNEALNFIRQGGSQPQGEGSSTQPQSVNGSKGRHTTKTDPNDQVSVGIKLLVRERNEINDDRSERLGRDKVSLEGWIIEAIQEKLQRVKKRKN